MRRPLSIAAFLALLLSGILTALVVPAQAAPSDRAELHRTGADSASARADVRHYWNKSTMKAAVGKRPERPSSGSRSVERGAPTLERGKPGGGTSSGYIGGPWTGGGRVVATTGKVFFTEGSTNYVCSGSAVTSANKSTVTTAGHCVNEGPGAYVSNFMFVPAYDHGAAPYGKWVATTLSTTSEWRTAGDFNYDVGMAKVAQLNAKYLTDVVGGQGVGFNQPRRELTYAFGYPQASPYDGTRLDYCSGTTTNDTRGGTNDLRLACNMTGGSSGGPWFQSFSASTGVGTQTSVNSFGYRGEKNAMYGPYFGSVIQSLFNTLQAS